MFVWLNQSITFIFMTHVLNEHRIMKFSFLLLRTLFSFPLLLKWFGFEHLSAYWFMLVSWPQIMMLMINICVPHVKIIYILCSNISLIMWPYLFYALRWHMEACKNDFHCTKIVYPDNGLELSKVFTCLSMCPCVSSCLWTVIANARTWFHQVIFLL